MIATAIRGINAEYVLEGGGVTIIPHQYKVIFDKGEAKKIIEANPEEGKKYESCTA